MGCFRLGCSFLFSLFVLVFLTVFFALLGSLLPLGDASPAFSLSSPQELFQHLSPGTLIGGAVGATIGLIVMVSMMKRASDVNWLKKHGRRIIATVTDIQKKSESRSVPYSTGKGTQYRTEWQTYYIVIARWENPQTRQTHTFRSERRASYPRKYAPGSGIPVLIDPQNPARYLVEV